MRAVVTSSRNWTDEQAVIDTICELPAGTTVLLPTTAGACGFVMNNRDELKLDVEDWSPEDGDYDRHGSTVNNNMLRSDVDVCFVFMTAGPGSHAAKDCLRQARLMDLDVRVLGG